MDRNGGRQIERLQLAGIALVAIGAPAVNLLPDALGVHWVVVGLALVTFALLLVVRVAILVSREQGRSTRDVLVHPRRRS